MLKFAVRTTKTDSYLVGLMKASQQFCSLIHAIFPGYIINLSNDKSSIHVETVTGIIPQTHCAFTQYAFTYDMNFKKKNNILAKMRLVSERRKHKSLTLWQYCTLQLSWIWGLTDQGRLCSRSWVWCGQALGLLQYINFVNVTKLQNEINYVITEVDTKHFNQLARWKGYWKCQMVQK